MLRKYFFLFKSHLIILALLVILVIISSITRGTTATTTSIIAGILMIYAGITFFVWIIKTPTKKTKEEVV
jgi:amino acid permease